MEFDESQARLRGVDQIGVDSEEAGRLPQEVAETGMAQLHVLLSR